MKTAMIKHRKKRKAFGVAFKIMKKYKLSKKTSLMLGMDPSFLSRCPEEETGERAKRSDRINDEVKKKITIFFHQPDVSTSIPDKRSVRKDIDRKALDRPLKDVYNAFKARKCEYD